MSKVNIKSQRVTREQKLSRYVYTIQKESLDGKESIRLSASELLEVQKEIERVLKAEAIDRKSSGSVRGLKIRGIGGGPVRF